MAVNAIWESLINTTASGSAISKTSGSEFFWNASALSQQAIAGNGYVEFTSPSALTQHAAVGLSNDATANTWVGMSHAIAFVGQTQAYVYESGTYRTDTAWIPGDVFQIEIFDSTSVRYRKNGTIFYTSAVTRSTPVKADVSFLTTGAGISAVTLEGVGGNQAPVVSAGNDQTVALGDTVTLSGSVTDDDLPAEATVTQTWTKVSGPGIVTFTNASAASTTAVIVSPGVYVLRLTATDTALTASDDCTITVSAGISPTTYDLIYDLATYPLPTLPAIGGAGSQVIDQTFRTPIYRVTDQATRNGQNYGTFGAPNSCQWAPDSSAFMAPTEGGEYDILTFDASGPSWALEQTVTFGNEPCWSRAAGGADSIYCVRSSGLYGVHRYSRTARTFTELYDVRTDVPDAPQYLAPVYASRNDWLVLAFGGIQETWRYITAFDANDPANRVTLDTRSSLIKVDGGAWTAALLHDGTAANIDIGIHSLSIDRLGHKVKIDISGTDGGPYTTWWLNLETNRLHLTQETDAPSGGDTWGGHYALGEDSHVNPGYLSGERAPQYLFRDLSQGGVFSTVRSLINYALVATPQRWTDHPSWNNSRAGALIPFVTAAQRSVEGEALNDPWRALHNEVYAIPTADNGGTSLAYRICHHRMTIIRDGVSTYSFRDSPRPQVSPDGMWTLFTSNWDYTLGTFGTATFNHRRDLFLVKNARVAATLPGAPSNPSPADGATDVSLTPTISVTGGTGATSHDFYLSVTNPPTTLVATGAALSFVPAALVPNTTYYLRVDARNSEGVTPSPVWDFVTVNTGSGGGPVPLPQTDIISRTVAVNTTISRRVDIANG